MSTIAEAIRENPKVDLDGCSVYGVKSLTQLAKDSVRGLGRYQGWDLRVSGHGTSLVAWYVEAVKAMTVEGPKFFHNTRSITIAI